MSDLDQAYQKKLIDRRFPLLERTADGALVVEITGAGPMPDGTADQPTGSRMPDVTPAPEMTEETWRTDPAIQSDLATAYSAFTGMAPPDPETLAQWGIEKISNFNLALGDVTDPTGTSGGGGMIAQATQILNSFTPDQAGAFARLLDAHDQLPTFTLPGFGRFVRNVAADPTSMVGVATLGAGMAGRQVAKEGVKQALRQRIGQAIVANPVKTVAGEAAVYTGAGDAITQNVKVAGGTQEAYDPLQTAGATALGAVVGAGIAKGIQVAAPYVGKAWSVMARNAQSGSSSPSGGPSSQRGAIGIKTSYEGVSDPLMGFRKGKPNVPSADSNYKHVEYLRLTDSSGNVFYDAMFGLNKQHALERARRNWDDGITASPMSRDEMLKADPGLVQIVDDELSTKLARTVASKQRGAVGDLNAHGQFKFDNEIRGVRDELQRVVLSADEKTKVAEVAAASKIPESAVAQALKEQLARFPERAGWRRPVLSKASLTKEGKVELEFAKEAYGFNRTGLRGKAGEQAEKELAGKMAARLVKEVKQIADRADKGDKGAKVIMASKNWYRAMRDRLRAEFGSFADVFADVIGTTSAQTNVQQNWENAIEVMRRFTRGDYDVALGKLDAWLKNGGTIDSYTKANTDLVKQNLPAATEQAKAEGLSGDALKERAKSIALAEANKEFPLITKETGKLFNTNSPQTMGALLDLFRVREAGGSPKTPNFTGNLIGYSDLATIDVWAARTLRRIYDEAMGKGAAPRLPPVMEQGVGGTVSADLQSITGEFGFGQDVFRQAAQTLRKDARFAGLGDDDLQAIVWFAEKERWTKNKWTTVQGEGGSLEFEANHAGVSDQAAVKRARQMVENDPTRTKREAWAAEIPQLAAKEADLLKRIQAATDEKEIKSLTAELNRTVKKLAARPEQIAAAEAELAANKAAGHRFLEENQRIVRRFTGGLSMDTPGKVASDQDMLTGHAEIASVLGPDPEVIMLKAQPTTGRYIDPQGQVWDERSFDMEWITRANFDPTAAMRKVVQVAKKAKQQSTFFSEVVKPGTVQTANPGVEVYFKQKLPQSEVDKITKLANQSGLDVGFTFATDLRFQNRGKGTQPGDFVGIRMQYIPEFGGKMTREEAQEKLLDFSEKLRGIDGVSNSQYVEYDTKVFFEGGYDAFLERTAAAGGAEIRPRKPDGDGSAGPVREQSQAGSDGGADVPGRRGSGTARTQRKQTGLMSDATSQGGGK